MEWAAPGTIFYWTRDEKRHPLTLLVSRSLNWDKLDGDPLAGEPGRVERLAGIDQHLTGTGMTAYDLSGEIFGHPMQVKRLVDGAALRERTRLWSVAYLEGCLALCF